MPGDVDREDPRLRLDYASPRTPRPDATTRLIIGLLITFLALWAIFFAIIIYASWIR
jgi:hypothetical protein